MRETAVCDEKCCEVFAARNLPLLDLSLVESSDLNSDFQLTGKVRTQTAVHVRAQELNEVTSDVAQRFEPFFDDLLLPGVHR